MANIVAAICMSHAPGASGWPTAPEPAVQERLKEIHATIADYLEAARPDLIIALLNDHFENHFRTLMPAFAIGAASSSMAPHEHIMSAIGYAEQKRIIGAPHQAECLINGLLASGFDVARMEEVAFGNNLMTPLKLIRPEADIAVLPIFTNVFTRPVVTAARAYAFGEALRAMCERDLGDARIALLATGGLSHWPPIWTEDAPADDKLLQRMRKLQSHGPSALENDPHLITDLGRYEMTMAERGEFPLGHKHQLINPEWDRKIMRAFAQGDSSFIKSLTFDDIVTEGGHGGVEVLNWTIVMGAMGGRSAAHIGYEAVREFICGMGYMVYPTFDLRY